MHAKLALPPIFELIMSRKLKDYRNIYREWRQNPVDYKYPGEKHRCDCCGEEHEGNYCPLCGQKASLGPVTWKSVWGGVMELWGLHSRSLPYTAWQLLFRPGHLMRDYVTGKRQVSFPPVKMLVLLGVIVYLLGHWLSPQEYSHEIGNITATGSFYYISYAWNWLLKHQEWYTLFLFSALIFPTWYVFRHAPLLKRHTLPQGFFIQVFGVNQSMVISLIALLMTLMLYFVPKGGINVVAFLITIIYLFIDYKQLFGYSWWGTIWRLLMIAVIISLVIANVSGVISIFTESHDSSKPFELIGSLFSLLFLLWITYLMIYFTDVINRKAWLERGKWVVVKWQLFITVAIILSLVLAISIASI